MSLAPVVLFVYNRPEHTRKVLESLMNNESAEQSELFIYSDGARANKPDEQALVEKVREVIREKKWCSSVTIVESKANKGLANSIIDGVTEIVNKYGKVIVLEDDLVTSKWFLKYMNDALNEYERSEDVACISAYVYPVKENLPQTFFIRGADCWGWATWKRTWDIFEKNGNKLLDQIRKQNQTAAFDFDNTYPYTKMLEEQIAGINNSWAIRWYASAFLKNKYCLYPGKSLVQNIGIDGSGTHSTSSTKWKVKLATQLVKVGGIKLSESQAGYESFKKYFQSLKPNLNRRAINYGKRILSKLLPK